MRSSDGRHCELRAPLGLQFHPDLVAPARLAFANPTPPPPRPHTHTCGNAGKLDDAMKMEWDDDAGDAHAAARLHAEHRQRVRAHTAARRRRMSVALATASGGRGTTSHVTPYRRMSKAAGSSAVSGVHRLPVASPGTDRTHGGAAADAVDNSDTDTCSSPRGVAVLAEAQSAQHSLVYREGLPPVQPPSDCRRRMSMGAPPTGWSGASLEAVSGQQRPCKSTASSDHHGASPALLLGARPGRGLAPLTGGARELHRAKSAAVRVRHDAATHESGGATAVSSARKIVLYNRQKSVGVQPLSSSSSFRAADAAAGSRGGGRTSTVALARLPSYRERSAVSTQDIRLDMSTPVLQRQLSRDRPPRHGESSHLFETSEPSAMRAAHRFKSGPVRLGGGMPRALSRPLNYGHSGHTAGTGTDGLAKSGAHHLHPGVVSGRHGGMPHAATASAADRLHVPEIDRVYDDTCKDAKSLRRKRWVRGRGTHWLRNLPQMSAGMPLSAFAALSC